MNFRTRLVPLVALGFLLSACASWFGPTETPAQKGFSKLGEYVYISIPLAKYASHPGATESTQAALCNLDTSVYSALILASQSFEAGADDATIALLEASSILASFNLQVLGGLDIPDDTAALAAQAAQRSLLLASIVLQSAAEMRLFRQGYLQAKLEAMGASERDPTVEEWAELRAKAEAQHERIQSSCVSEGV